MSSHSTPEYNHQNYLRNRARVLARTTKYQREHPEINAAACRKWLDRHPHYHRNWAAQARRDPEYCERQRASARRCYARHPERVLWNSMLRRCRPENQTGRNACYAGVKVCKRWQGKNGFKNFLADMGPRPSPEQSLDRFPKQDGDYKPSNCRWATSEQQSRNKRNNVVIEFRGQRKCQSDWAREIGVDVSTLIRRREAGWPIERVLAA